MHNAPARCLQYRSTNAGATKLPPVGDAEIPGDTGSVPARSSPTLRKGSSIVAESARLASTPVPHASSSSTEEDGPHRRLVIVGTRMDDHSLRSQVGMGSESECLFGQLHRISRLRILKQEQGSPMKEVGGGRLKQDLDTRRDRSRGIRDDVTSGEPEVVSRERTWTPQPVAQPSRATGRPFGMKYDNVDQNKAKKEGPGGARGQTGSRNMAVSYTHLTLPTIYSV